MAASSGVSGSKSSTKILANIFISFIGAGVLGLPFAFKEAGILEGIFIMSFVGLLSVKAMLLIVDCKYKLIDKQEPFQKFRKKKPPSVIGSAEDTIELLEINHEANGAMVTFEEPDLPVAPRQDLTYGDVGYYAMGTFGTTIIDMSIVLTQTGFCCAYLIFITENLSSYAPNIKMYHWLLVMLPVLWLFTLLRHLNLLAITSLFAQISNLMAFTVVFWFDFEHFSAVKMHPKTISIQGLPFFFSIAVYCYEGAGMILSLESSIHEEKRGKFKKFFKSTLLIVTLLYISFGVCGYLSFGPHTNSIITLNLPAGQQSMDFSLVVKSFLCLALYFTYPVMMFPVIKIIEKKMIEKPTERIWHGNLLRLLMVILTGLIVLVVPNFSNLMALVGASCCNLLAFILPGIFHMRIFKGSLTKCQSLTDTLLIVIGVLATIVGTQDAIRRMTGHIVTTATHNDHQIDASLHATSNLTTAGTTAMTTALRTVLTRLTTRKPG